MTLSKKIIMSLIFWGASVCHAQTAQPKEAMPYKLEDGSRFQVCKDVTAYLNTYRAQLESRPREVFTLKIGKFNKPKSTPSTVERYVQLSLQELAYSKIELKDRSFWKNEINFKRINAIEDIIYHQLAVKELKIDINNDGIRERIFNYSFFEEKLKVWVHINYLLDDDGNLNLASKKELRSLGELFYYDGRTYWYAKKGHNKIMIGDHFPSYRQIGSSSPEEIEGLVISPPLCKISQLTATLDNVKG